MSGVEALLEQRERDGNPLRVGIVGAGFMASGLVNHIVNTVPGMQVAGVFARRPERAKQVLLDAGIQAGDVSAVDSASGVDGAVHAGGVAVTDDFTALTGAGAVDVIVDCTGAVEFGAQLALATIDAGKHLVLMNAEVDATIGPLLSHRAEAAGVVYTGCDGDQPGVQMNLVRFVRSLGLRPLVAGNIKGLQDRFRNPTTQEGFARRWGQDPHMVTSFADGTKCSVEQALVANASGMSVHRRGMLGRDHAGHVDELTTMYDVDELRELGGAVDYVVGTRPGPGVYVLGEHPDPKQRHYLELYKLGTGPLYSFYTPYHLCHFEVPGTIAKAALFGTATIRPVGTPTVDVVTLAKIDLPAGTVLDALGGYHYYGECERADTAAREQLLPVGLAEGGRLLRDIPATEPITRADVELPSGRLCDELRAEQDALFGFAAAGERVAVG